VAAPFSVPFSVSFPDVISRRFSLRLLRASSLRVFSGSGARWQIVRTVGCVKWARRTAGSARRDSLDVLDVRGGRNRPANAQQGFWNMRSIRTVHLRFIEALF
jgi:hypothetical protein